MTISFTGINGIDIIVIAVVVVFAAIGFFRGFIISCLGFIPSLAAFLGVYLFQPSVSKALRATAVFEKFKVWVSGLFDIENIVSQNAGSAAEIINNIDMPDFIKNALLENDNSVVYQIFDASKLEEYIVSYIANICINIISVLVIFILIFAAASAVLNILNFIAAMPGLNIINRFGGLAMGAAQGVVIVWVFGIISLFLSFVQWIGQFWDMLSPNGPAMFLLQNNWLLYMIMKIFS